MIDRRSTWTVVLAAGEGRRLQVLTTSADGGFTPKQFCALQGRPQSLLADTVARAERLVPIQRIVVVVAAEHERWWRPELVSVPRDNIVVQPRNRGTAVGVLLPLVQILRRDPEARVVVMASDHYVRDEGTLTMAFRLALERLASQRAPVTLLGIMPDAAEADYGWIVPGTSARHGTLPVRRFVEKPGEDLARRLQGVGAVWNSFLLVARGPALLRLYRRRLPVVLDALLRARNVKSLTRLYERIEAADFSRDVLQGAEGLLRVLTVPACGWTDLGTPTRVLAWLRDNAGPASVRDDQSARFDLCARVGHG